MTSPHRRSLGTHFQMLEQARGCQANERWLDGLLDLLAGDERTRGVAFAEMLEMLERDPACLAGLRQVLWQEIDRRNHLSFLVEAGLPQDGAFVGELARRIGNQLLPPVPDDFELADLAGELFSTVQRAAWSARVPLEQWEKLFALLAAGAPRSGALPDLFATSVPTALLILAQRIGALGVEPEITRRLPALEHYHSPFIRLGADVGRLLDWREQGAPPEEIAEQFRAVQVLRVYCLRSLEAVHRSHDATGISLRVVALLDRLRRCLERLEALLCFVHPEAHGNLARPAVRLFLLNIAALARRNSVRDHWRTHTSLLALKIIEHNQSAGEHYISRDRTEFLSLLRSALGGGAVTALTSLLKLIITQFHLASLVQAGLSGLNYAASFAAIQLCHFSLATKQPAMTASVLAAALAGDPRQGIDLGRAVGLVTRICRSQIISVFGNLAAVIPISLLLHFAWLAAAGEALCGVEKAHHLLEANHPWHSLSLFYAGITGGCLFLSGLISGYFDNLANCFALHERIRRHSLLRRMLGARIVEQIANRLHRSIGGLAGNIGLGLILGFLPFLGVISGLPLDVRHVTLATGNLTLALAGLGPEFRPAMIFPALGSVLLIGTMNLLVSFGLSLLLAARANGASNRLLRRLLAEVWAHLWHSPWQFLYPKVPRQIVLPGRTEEA